MRLSKKVRNRLQRDLKLRQGLAWISGVSERTIKNRAKANSVDLTTADCINFLKEHTDIPESELLVDETNAK